MKNNKMKHGVFAGMVGLPTAFLAPAFGQGDMREPDFVSFGPLRPLNKTEQQSRVSKKGRNTDRYNFHGVFVKELGALAPLIAQNEYALLHIASTTKVITGAAFYYCWDLALREAQTKEQREVINQKFLDVERAHMGPMLVYSNNKHANYIAMFLENLELDFINKAVAEQGLSRGHYRVFSTVIAPRLFDSLGMKATQIKNPNGLPPYDFRRTYSRGDEAGEYIYPPEERPFNFTGQNKKKNDPVWDDYLDYRDFEDYNISTPEEMARLLEYVIVRYPKMVKVMGQPIVRDSLRNSNFWGEHVHTSDLLENRDHYMGKGVPGVDIVKTGTTTGAGCVNIVSAERNGVRIIVVDMGHFSKNGVEGDKKGLERHTTQLIEQAFAMLEPKMKANIRRDSLAAVEKRAQEKADSLALVEVWEREKLHMDSIRSARMVSIDTVKIITSQMDSLMRLYIQFEEPKKAQEFLKELQKKMKGHAPRKSENRNGPSSSRGYSRPSELRGGRGFSPQPHPFARRHI